MNTKEKGSRNEREFKHSLEYLHYYAGKAGASLGVYDIIADALDDEFNMFEDIDIESAPKSLKKHIVVIKSALAQVEPPNLYHLLIQSKSNRLPSKQEIFRIAQTSVRPAHAKLIVVRHDRKDWEIWRVFAGCSYCGDEIFIQELTGTGYKGWIV